MIEEIENTLLFKKSKIHSVLRIFRSLVWMMWVSIRVPILNYIVCEFLTFSRKNRSHCKDIFHLEYEILTKNSLLGN